MTRAKLEDEVEEIGAQLKNMRQKRKSGEEDAATSADSGQQEQVVADESIISDANLSALREMLAEFDAEELIDSISTHAGTWLGALNEDLKNTKPSTLLTVFGLGVIVGRLTK